jgi:hypothetical protein
MTTRRQVVFGAATHLPTPAPYHSFEIQPVLKP